MPNGSTVTILWGISFDESWKVQKGDTIKVKGDERVIQYKEDSVVYVEPFRGSTKNLLVDL